MNRAPGRLRFDHDHVVTHEERYESGRAARSRIPRSSQAHYVPDAARDPLGVLDQQHARRLPDLVPLRIARMLQDPFAFYRGTAAIQAADLAGLPTSGADIVICGDAHIANFGLFASPERSMVFDLNDFDEATTGPWEWDLKRMVTSVVIAARGRGASDARAREAALHAARTYRDALHQSLGVPVTERFFLPAVVRGGRQFGKKTQRVVRDLVAASEKRTSERVISRITERAADGSLHLIEAPPRLTHVPPEMESVVGEVLARYSRTVSPDIALLLSQHTVTDVARRVVGVGSVGTRCFIVVLTGPHGEALILQIKEATDSVVQEFGGVEREEVAGIDRERLGEHHGYRVTAKQRILQAVSDPFLGYVTFEGFGFYVRQFRDRNVSFDIDRMAEQTFDDYAFACAQLLARAHSRSANAAFIAGYIGHGDVLPEAVTTWALSYADQSHADYETLQAAVVSGRYEAAPL
ncbi:DUF2252 domain-containing protein [Leifsonia poae]|uniref:DUF2252 domain-containing protein n=1 Tax=Leifsonia poae TaxID=110933 RepID=A0A9W6HBN6_9MICO|nr:DUF2252 domain-containing protein [Leifsonia poae]GLJ77064.1 hypothetical protein GCM10017584_26380 [Leifsonia poae]